MGSDGEHVDASQRAVEAYCGRFGTTPTVVGTAPGRVNLIGEHTDYNEGFVLPCAIDLRAAFAVGEGTDGLYSVDFGEWKPVNGCAEGTWADYPRGVAWALAQAGRRIPRFQGALAGDVPVGSGLSSSAAVEAATALGLLWLSGQDMPRRETALLCQRAENQFVGVNSGIMDQYASLLCVEGAALLIDCRSLEAEEVPLDLERAGLVLLVCYTGTQRTLASSGYNERRAECERAAAELGVSSLRDATLADLEKLHGVELRRARHIVTENARVLEAVDALHEGDFAHVGRLMIASHESLRDDYEVSTPQLDAFVDTATQHGALGARLTGAGFGGCAIALVAGDAAGGITDAVTERFAREGFGTPTFYRFHPSRGADVLSGPAEQAAS